MVGSSSGTSQVQRGLRDAHQGRQAWRDHHRAVVRGAVDGHGSRLCWDHDWGSSYHSHVRFIASQVGVMAADSLGLQQPLLRSSCGHRDDVFYRHHWVSSRIIVACHTFSDSVLIQCDHPDHRVRRRLPILAARRGQAHPLDLDGSRRQRGAHLCAVELTSIGNELSDSPKFKDQSEMAPAKWRGAIINLYQTVQIVGVIVVSY